jgi:hypothetical protein
LNGAGANACRSGERKARALSAFAGLPSCVEAALGLDGMSARDACTASKGKAKGKDRDFQ